MGSKNEHSEHTEHSEHRTGSSFAAYFNIVCVIAGTGVLALPQVLAEAGWLGLLMFAVTAAVSIKTSNMLIECLYYKEGSRLAEFPDIPDAAFGPMARNITKVFHYSISLSSGCIYILLTGIHTNLLLETYMVGYESKEWLWILIAGVVVGVPFVFLKTLKEVTLLGVFGAFTTLVSIMCVVIQGGIDYSSKITETYRLEGLPTALSTIAFAYGGTVVFPHVEGTMKNPRAWRRTLFLAISSITAMYVLMAVTGYLYYGKEVEAPVFKSMGNNFGSLLGMILITLHVVLAAPIYLCSFSLEQERALNFEAMDPKKQFLARVALRATLIVILTAIAMTIPYFRELMSIIGAISNSIIIFLIPVVCHYKLFGSSRRSLFSHFTSLITILFGVFGLTVGTFFAFKDLVKAYENNHKK